MKKVKVSLSMLLRQVKTTVVEVPDDFDDWFNSDKMAMLKNLYQEDEGSSGWEDDIDWGVEEGTHCILGPVDDSVKAEFIVDNNKIASYKVKNG